MRRYPELDALRGLAVLLMVIYHLLFDLSYFYGFAIPVREGLLLIAARVIAGTFLILVGVGSAISLSRKPPSSWAAASLRRATTVGLAAIVVSVLTGLLVPAAFVRFGILHLIALSAVLVPFFFSAGRWNVLLGIFILILGPHVLRSLPSLAILLPIGSGPPVAMLDYFPLIPWFGVILLGLGLGHALYVPTRRAWIPEINAPEWLLWCGRRALFLYMVHQPVILLILWVMLGKSM